MNVCVTNEQCVTVRALEKVYRTNRISAILLSLGIACKVLVFQMSPVE